jgi:hypothetical protein
MGIDFMKYALVIAMVALLCATGLQCDDNDDDNNDDDVNNPDAGADADADADSDSDADTDSDADADADADADSDSDPPAGECSDDNDCSLHNDCCVCRAVSPLELVATCKMVCDQSACDALGPDISEALCVSGRCVTNAKCRESNVMCDMVSPNCDKGMVPLLTGDGTCYAGSCILATECSDLSAD